MSNRDLAAAWAYHNATKHSYWSIRQNAHYLDWPNQPMPFKIYPQLDPTRLPREVPPLEMPALAAISATGVYVEGEAVPDLKDLVQVLYYSAGITKQKGYPGGEILFRAASCTGALYEIELYLVCGNLPDLEAGVYHFNPGDLALRRLRPGDWRGLLARATAAEPAIAAAPVTIICTGIYWRNAWKYQARTYRHFGWDNGTLLGNLLATATALNLPARVVMGFVDDEVNQLLGLDTEREVAFSIVPLGRVSPPPPAPPARMEPLDLEVMPYSRREVDYPAMRQMHAASSLLSEEEVAAWRGGTPVGKFPEPAGKLIPLRPLADDEMSRDPLGQVILRRGSTRRFARESLSFGQLSTLLYRSMQGIPADFLDPVGAHLNSLYLIVHAVDELAPGAYVLRHDRWALELLKEGEFRAEAGYLGLEQELPADASATIFFLADLPPVLERFGNRGYRAAQLESGIIGGKLYLAAYGQGFGATGLTFYDDYVTQFFSPHAEGKSAIFHVAVGKSAKHRLSVVREA
jgi:SagB-type dehydrogenase family enzyme